MQITNKAFGFFIPKHFLLYCLRTRPLSFQRVCGTFQFLHPSLRSKLERRRRMQQSRIKSHHLLTYNHLTEVVYCVCPNDFHKEIDRVNNIIFHEKRYTYRHVIVRVKVNSVHCLWKVRVGVPHVVLPPYSVEVAYRNKCWLLCAGVNYKLGCG